MTGSKVTKTPEEALDSIFKATKLKAENKAQRLAMTNCGNCFGNDHQYDDKNWYFSLNY